MAEQSIKYKDAKKVVKILEDISREPFSIIVRDASIQGSLVRSKSFGRVSSENTRPNKDDASS